MTNKSKSKQNQMQIVVKQAAVPAVKKASKKRKKSKQQQNKPAMMGALIRKVCGLTDPFCVAAIGAMYPDDTGGSVIAERIEHYIPFRNDVATGNAMYVFVADPIYPYWSGSYSGTTFTLGVNRNAPVSSSLLQSYGNEYRVVSWGVECINTLNAMTTAGELLVGKLDNVNSGSTITELLPYYNQSKLYAWSPGRKVTAISNPLGKECRNFMPMVPFTQTVDNGWESLVFECHNGVTTPSNPQIGYFHVVYNIEFTIGRNTATGGVANVAANLARKSPPDNPLLIQATSRVQSTMSSIMDGLGDRVESIMKAAATAAVSSVVKSYTGYYPNAMIAD